MKNKRFLIIEEDDAARGIFYRCLVNLIPTASVVFEATADAGLDQIANQEFEVLIADLDLIRSAGNLWGQIWVSRGESSPLIVATSTTETRLVQTLLPIQSLLTKPLQLSDLERVIQEIVALQDDTAQEQMDQVDALYARVNTRMDQLLADTTARCILLCDPSGRTIHVVGDTRDLAIDSITSLLSGGIATLLEAGKNLDEQGVINLAYREGKQSDLYAINIHDDWILIIVIDRGQMYQRLGTVWFYARKATVDLNVLREELSKIKPVQAIDPQLDNAYNDELDKLFQ
jgi:FixJ family two-component response regulator